MSHILKSIFHRAKVVANLSEPMKMALIVRNDLRMTKGKTGAQCAHASIICYEKCQRKQPQLLSAWLHLGQPKIVLRVESMQELEEISLKAQQMNVIEGKVLDAGRTQVTAGTVTVLGLGPDTVGNIDALVKHLRLL
jgi:PTH2 family peptidyl-tRNA hydrolase